MMRKIIASIIIVSISFGALLPQLAQAATLSIGLTSFATGLTEPVGIVSTKVVGDTRLFVVERTGNIKIVQSNGTVLGTSFLNLSGIIRTVGGEEGLLGLAFHPSYNSNGFFYVYYINTSGDIVLARYTVSGDANVANGGSGQIMLTIPHPSNTNHNGGGLQFGPDGFLYVSVGDGGGTGDPSNNAQNRNNLLGKILRLDISPSTTPFYTPAAGNPFIATAGADEIWAYGLRNPWRISFDRSTGDLYIADVGQSAREEINFQEEGTGAGLNYGWRCYEGNAAYNSAGCTTGYTFPVSDYEQAGGRCSITGGFVYRGAANPNLTGRYVYADFCTGEIFTLEKVGSSWSAVMQYDGPNNLSTFGEDVNGEMYVAAIYTGTIYKIAGDVWGPTYRFWSDQNQSHFYTVDLSERNDVINNYPDNVWRYEGSRFKAALLGLGGTCPVGSAVYRFWSETQQSHFYTIDENEKNDVINNYPDNVWRYEFKAYCAYTTSQIGSTPLYRFWSDTYRSHFYTIDEGEKNDVINNYPDNVWKYEGIAYYVKP